MEKFITYENLRYFAYSNDHICKKPVRGIVMDFWGLGSTGMYHEDTETGKFYHSSMQNIGYFHRS